MPEFSFGVVIQQARELLPAARPQRSFGNLQKQAAGRPSFKRAAEPAMGLQWASFVCAVGASSCVCVGTDLYGLRARQLFVGRIVCGRSAVCSAAECCACRLTVRWRGSGARGLSDRRAL